MIVQGREVLTRPLQEIVGEIEHVVIEKNALYPEDCKAALILIKCALTERLIDNQHRFHEDFLGKLYRDWLIAPANSYQGRETWRRFVEQGARKQAENPAKKVEFALPTPRYLALPRVPAYLGNGIYSDSKTRINNDFQAGFGRALGILEAGEEWEDFTGRPEVRSLETREYKDAAAFQMKEPGVIALMNHDNMREMPLLLSPKFAGLAVHARLYNGKTKSGQPLILAAGHWVVLDMFVSSDLFWEESVSFLQTPAGKGRFLSEVCRQF